MSRNNILEICAGDIDSVLAAVKGGATRVELCSALNDGGISPSVGFIKQALNIEGLKVHVLIRPRGGDFLYTEEEIQIMLEDIKTCREMGVDGVVIGALKANGDIDIDTCKRLSSEAGTMSVTFHRAFDLCADPIKSLEEIIDLGCDRLLTSGQAATAEVGLLLLKKLVKKADNRIIILAGGGITAQNAAKIISECGTNEIHASARSTIHSDMEHINTVSMGENSEEYSRKTTNSSIVQEIINAIK